MLFLYFVLSHWLHHYLYNFFFNSIYVGLKNEGANLMKAVQFFDFLFSNNVMNGLKEKKEKKHVKQMYLVK